MKIVRCARNHRSLAVAVRLAHGPERSRRAARIHRSLIAHGGTARIGRLLTRAARINHSSLAVAVRRGRSLTVTARITLVLCIGPAMGSLRAQGGATGPEHPVTISRGTGNVRNCRRDFNCFIKAFDEGRAARVEQVRTGLFDGVLNSATVSFEFSNFTPDTVVYYIKWEDYKLQFTEEGRQQALRQGISGDALARKEKEAEEMQKSFKGRDGACLFRRAVVRGFLERWGKEGLSLDDYKRAEKCEGKAVAF